MFLVDKIKNIFRKRKLDTKAAEEALAAFKEIKGSATNVSSKYLQEYYKKAEKAIEGFALAGQKVACEKTKWLMKVVEKEMKLIELGYKKSVLRDDVMAFCEKHDSRVIMMCDIADYERVMPEEAYEIIAKTKDIFDQFIVIYTDHTREAARKVEKVRDPILFGIFIEPRLKVDVKEDGRDVYASVMSDRLYFLLDWEDDYCDLTLSRMIAESKKLDVNMQVEDVSKVKTIQQRVADMNHEITDGNQ